MNITIVVNGYRATIDSENIITKQIQDIIVGKTENLDTLIKRQTWIASQIEVKKLELAALLLAQNLASEAYSKFSQPHFTENMGDREKCVSCGSLTSWLWDYKPHCKNNNMPHCYDFTKTRVPLDSATQNELEQFLSEQEENK